MLIKFKKKNTIKSNNSNNHVLGFAAVLLQVAWNKQSQHGPGRRRL